MSTLANGHILAITSAPAISLTGHGSIVVLLTVDATRVQAEKAEQMSFAEPLKRYANSVAADSRLAYRGTLVGGQLKCGDAVNSTPEVRLPHGHTHRRLSRQML